MALCPLISRTCCEYECPLWIVGTETANSMCAIKSIAIDLREIKKIQRKLDKLSM